MSYMSYMSLIVAKELGTGCFCIPCYDSTLQP